jgi:Large polyvalent protein associated domain 38
MAFDPNKPFSLVEDGQNQPSGFDPSKPFELVPAQPQKQVPLSETATNMAADVAVEGGVSTAGQLIGGLTGPGYLAIAPLSGYYGNYLKQQQQIERGERKAFSQGEAIAAALINLLPAANAAKAFTKLGVDLAAKPVGTKIAATAGLRAVEGAGIAGVSKTIETGIEEGRFPTEDEYKEALIAGGALGSVVGGAEASIAAVFPKLSPAAKKMWGGFAGKKASDVGDQIDNLATNGTPEEKAAVTEIVDTVGERLGLVRKASQKSAEQSAREILGYQVTPSEGARSAREAAEAFTQLTPAESERQLIEMGLKREGAAPSAMESAAAMGILPVKPARESASILQQAPLTAEEQALRYVAGLEPKSAAESAAAMGVLPVKPARESASVLSEELQKQEARRAYLASEFEKARAEELQDVLATKGIKAPEQVTFDPEAPYERIGLNVIETRRGESARERARLEKALGVEKTTLPTEEQVLQQVENIPGVGGRAGARAMGLQGGFITPETAIPLARAGAGAVIGAMQGETSEERARNAMLGAGAGLLASPKLIKAAVSKISKKANTIEEAMADVQGVKPVAIAKGSEAKLPSEANPVVQKAITELNVPQAPKRKTLEDVDRLFEEPKEGQKFLTISDRMVELFQNSFRPLSVLEGKVRGFVPKFNLADKFSLIAGAGAKAEPAIREMDSVRSQLVGDIHPKDINRYFVLNRAANRLQRGILTEKLSLEDTSRLLTDLRTNLGADKIGRLEQFGKYMQDAADADLKMMVSSGRMSQELYDQIKATNDFYAPFHFTNRLGQLDYLSQRFKSGSAIDTQAELAKELSGFESEDLKLGDIFTAFKRNKYNAHILAEKSAAMRELVNLGYADKDGQFIKFIKKPKDAPEGFEAVSYLDNGKTKYLAVDTSVARAVSGMSPIELGVIGNLAQIGAAGLRTGATMLNAGWLTVNFPLDFARQSMVSKYGLKSPNELLPWGGYAGDFIQALGSAIKYNLPGKFSQTDDLYKTYLESGAARSNFQSIINQDAFTKAVLRGDDSAVAKMVDVADKYILSTPAKISNVLEETIKLMGLKRGMRIENVKDLTPEKRAEVMKEIAYETRNYAGSPDFSKFGSLGRQANLLFMFANARLQGVAADFARVAGRTGSKERNQALVATGIAFGLPTVALWSVNHLPENVEDYGKLSERDKAAFFNVPLYDANGPKYNTDKYGRKVRDYLRIPKRDLPSMMANTVDKAMDFYATQNPEAVYSWAINMADSISPVSISGKSTTERLQSILSSINPAIRIPFEQLGNIDFFRKKPIIPRELQEVSPKYQYTETTPEIYKNIAQAVPGVSPLRLENIVQGFTGAAVSQFVKKPQEGRNELASNPLLGRYFRSGTIDESANFELINTLRSQAADRAFEREMAIDDALTKALQAPIQQRQQIMRSSLPQEVIADPNFADTLVRMLVDKQYQVTPLERRVRSLQPSERAQYIYEQIKSFKRDDEKRVYLGRIATIPGMFTEDVAKFVSDFQKLEKRSQTLKR